MVDSFVRNNISKCIGCRACSAVCPERSIYITSFNFRGKITYHSHFKKEKQICEKCIKKNNPTPCMKICPEKSIEIISR